MFSVPCVECAGVWRIASGATLAWMMRPYRRLLRELDERCCLWLGVVQFVLR